MGSGVSTRFLQNNDLVTRVRVSRQPGRRFLSHALCAFESMIGDDVFEARAVFDRLGFNLADNAFKLTRAAYDRKQ